MAGVDIGKVLIVMGRARYVRVGGWLGEAEIQAVVDIVEKALAEGTFLAVNPRFLVTATV